MSRMLRSVAGGAGRPAAALVLFVALTICQTWPLATAPGRLTRHDNGDAILNEWAIAWVAHQLPRDPLHLFDANIFYPEPETLALSEHLLLQGVLAMPLLAGGLSTTLVHNLVLLAGLALSGWAMYLVIVRWTGDSLAGLVAGSLYAFNAHLMTRTAHLQAMHVEFLPLAVLALDRVLERPTARRALGLAAAFVLQSLASFYLLVFTAVALVAAGLSRPVDWWGARFRPRLLALGGAAGLSVLLLLPFLLPYARAHERGLVRPVEEMLKFSAWGRDYLSSGGWLHFRLWGERLWTPDSTALFPGIAGALLAAAALGSGLAWRDRRARMWLALGLAGFVLSFGPQVPGYRGLVTLFPLLEGVRAPVRFGLLPLAAVAALGGFVLARWRQAAGFTRRSTAVAVLVLVVVNGEAFRGPRVYTPALEIPGVYDVLRSYPRAVVADFPMARPSAIFRNARYMLYSTRHWHPILTGYSGFLPPGYEQRWMRVNQFPKDTALAALVDLGVTHVVVHDDVDLIGHADRSPGLVRLAGEDATVVYAIRLEAFRPGSTRQPGGP